MGYIQKFGKFIKDSETPKQTITETVEPPSAELATQFKAQYDQIQALTTKIQTAKNQLAIDEKNLQTLETNYVKAMADAKAKMPQPAAPTTPTA
jgi:DNA-binding protein H-NS